MSAARYASTDSMPINMEQAVAHCSAAVRGLLPLLFISNAVTRALATIQELGLQGATYPVTHRNMLATQAKAARAGPGVPPKQCYIRVSVGLPSGCSPGIPYVLEIWPPGHFSPIHNHGNAFGIVRMLHGSITSERPLFPHPVTESCKCLQ